MTANGQKPGQKPRKCDRRREEGNGAQHPEAHTPPLVKIWVKMPTSEKLSQVRWGESCVDNSPKNSRRISCTCVAAKNGGNFDDFVVLGCREFCIRHREEF